MWKIISLCAVFGCGLVDSSGDMGPGRWDIKYITKCEEATHKFKFDITKKRINRTHDGIDACFTLDEDFTDIYAVRIDLCKEVDGGCKPYQVISENSFTKFAEKYAGENVKAVFEALGINPPEFPLPAGTYELKDFMFDTEELPNDGPYGEFTAKCYMLEGNLEIGCVEIWLEFVEGDQEE